MPITTYGRILDIIQDNTRDSIDKEVAMISILANKTPDEVEDMPLVELRGLTSQLGFLTEKAEAVEVRKEYKVGDVVSFKLEYGAVLKLATSKYVEKAYI
jgi:hypothetical protein